jgi:chondroitin 4-sulfotransferase 11
MALKHCYRVIGQPLAIVCIPKVAGTSIRATVEVDPEPMFAHEAQNAGLFVAGFVRNPYDRLVSAWANKTREITPKLELLGFREGMRFKEFFWLAEQYATVDHHLAPQHTFLMKGPRLAVDYIGRFERLNDDWKRLQMMFDLPPLKHENKSVRERGFKEYYTGDLGRRAKRLYQRDLSLFGYGRR